MKQKYSFTLCEDSKGMKNITISEDATGKTKMFSTYHSSCDRIEQHMLSLTDEQIKQWFKEKQ